MALATNMSGYVGQGAWNYYNVKAVSANDLLLSATMRNNGDDCDIYVKENHLPSRTSYDYSDLSTSHHSEIIIIDPKDSVWYIGIYGFSQCTYTLTVAESDLCECAPPPVGHGHCEMQTPTCICDEGWVGEHCDSRVAMLENKERLQSQLLSKNNWNYYLMRVQDSSAFSLTIRETNSTGYAWVYVSHSEFPTLSVYDYADIKDTSIHELSKFWQTPLSGDLYIGVYGSPNIADSGSGKPTSVNYDIVGFVTDFRDPGSRQRV
tara:strand:- start:3 stop:791 length:789 start_codon:yes stop_codon:yes gene_type:complete